MSAVTHLSLSFDSLLSYSEHYTKTIWDMTEDTIFSISYSWLSYSYSRSLDLHFSLFQSNLTLFVVWPFWTVILLYFIWIWILWTYYVRNILHFILFICEFFMNCKFQNCYFYKIAYFCVNVYFYYIFYVHLISFRNIKKGIIQFCC